MTFKKNGGSSNILRKKSLDMIIEDANDKKHALKKSLSWFDLILFGIGAIIGTGIFVLTGVAAAKYAGPGLILSFILSGIACTFAALSYAEFASTFPAAGSTYSYSYVALGEIFAWIIGWDLILEYAFAIPTIALGWSGYFTSLLHSFGVNIPAWAANSASSAPGGIINLPAIGIVLLLGIILLFGTKESSIINNIAVIFKIMVVLFFIAVAIGHVNPSNWKPFLPYGWKGVFSGAAIIFFAYIGFDSVSTAAEETKNPARDMPIGILGSLGISTLLYIAVVAILTGVVSYTKLNTPEPVAFALTSLGINWASGLVSFGAIAGITTVLLVMMYGQTRIFFAMSRDGLLPPFLSKLHEKYKTPVASTIIVALFAAVVAGFFSIDELAKLVNIGTMFAFVLVSVAVIVLRYTKPELPRKFRCPLVPLIPILSIASTVFLMISLPLETWIRFIVWFVLGIIIYFFYGYRHSKLAQNDYKGTKVESLYKEV
ncbi:MAG: basic amino acid/polyamine antiporter, family [Thermoanaerobacterium sp.]|nr:basic amino acid/polyamine antiporter, family [Thermoanaerobacterium sp.]